MGSIYLFLQYSSWAYNARIGNRWAESEARAVAKGEDSVAGLKEDTCKIMHLSKMLYKRSQGRAVVNFDRDFYSILNVLHN